MLAIDEVKRLVRSYLLSSHPDADPLASEKVAQLDRLMHAANADVCDVLFEELSASNAHQRLIAARLLLNAFRYDERISTAIDVFRKSLESDSADEVAYAFALLAGLRDMPADLMRPVRSHLALGGPNSLAAAMVATEFDDLRAHAFKVLGFLLENEDLNNRAKLLAALSMVRLNYGVEKAWQIIDRVEAQTDDPQFSINCIDGLFGIYENPKMQTVQRIVSLAVKLESGNRAELLKAIQLLGTLRADADEIDQFLLQQVATAEPSLVYAAATALNSRNSSRCFEAQTTILSMFSSDDIKTREVAALALVRCFEQYSDEVTRAAAAQMKVERDIEVIELLMRLCQRIGTPAFRVLFEEWQHPANLRGWIQTMTLGWLSEQSIDDLFRLVIDEPSGDSQRLLAMLVMGAKVGPAALTQKLLEAIRTSDETALKTTLVALQMSDANAAFLVPDLIRIAVRHDRPILSDLASKVLFSIGLAALHYFPVEGEGESSLPVHKLRRAIEIGIPADEKHFLHEVSSGVLYRFSLAGRLIADKKCSSLREASSVLVKQFPRQKGWSTQSIKRATAKLERLLTKQWGRKVVLLETAIGISTSPTKLTEEGLRVLRFIEQHEV